MKTRIRDLRWMIAGLATIFLSYPTMADEKPEVFVQLGNTGWVQFAAMSADGKTVASGDFSGEIKLWDAVSGKEIRTLKAFEKGHTGNVISVAFSPDGRWVSSFSIDSSCRLWEVQSGKQLQKIDTKFDGFVKSPIFSTT